MSETRTTDTEPPRPAEGPIARSGNFLSDVIQELHKVVWPNRHQLFTASAVVLVVVIAVAVFLWGVDELMGPLVGWISGTNQ